MTFLRSALVCAVIACSGSVSAQTNINLGTINADPTDPVEITAENLSVDQESGSAVFQGNVVIGQGNLRLSAGRVQVIYNGDTGNVSSLEASGGVTFVTETEAAEAQRADYDLEAGTLVLMGDVLLTQGASAISSDTMRIDLTSGAAQMNGNVRTIFNQDGN